MRFIYNIWFAFTGLFYPNLCAVCGTNLLDGEDVVCLSCRYNMPKTGYWKFSDNPVIQSFWGRVVVEKACSYFTFKKGSVYQKLLHKLKYKGQKEIGLALGKLFADELMRVDWLKGVDVIIPVPLHPRKLRVRGYNQSECIACGISLSSGIEVLTDVLLKQKDTLTQTQKSRQDRWDNVATTFIVNDIGCLQGKHILLVDDVLTTGATLEACAQTLLNACDCKVSIVTLAYAPL